MKNWKTALGNIGHVTMASFHGYKLFQHIDNHRANDNKWELVFECALCGKSMYKELHQIHYTHLEHDSTGPNLTCPHCRHAGDNGREHSYVGINSI